VPVHANVRVAERCRQSRQRAGEAREQADEWVADLGEHIEQRPFGSVLMAFGVGFVVGKLLDRG